MNVNNVPKLIAKIVIIFRRVTILTVYKVGGSGVSSNPITMAIIPETPNTPNPGVMNNSIDSNIDPKAMSVIDIDLVSISLPNNANINAMIVIGRRSIRPVYRSPSVPKMPIKSNNEFTREFLRNILVYMSRLGGSSSYRFIYSLQIMPEMLISIP
ncbi:MAG: hypothetical protein QXY23_00785 [Ignisphaera sp.]